MAKPLIIEKRGKKWLVFVHGHPVVKVDGKLNYGSDLPILPPNPFPTKAKAESIAHLILRYKLNMGDMLFAHTEYRDASKKAT